MFYHLGAVYSQKIGESIQISVFFRTVAEMYRRRKTGLCYSASPAVLNKEAGTKALTTETGDGQRGSALAMEIFLHGQVSMRLSGQWLSDFVTRKEMALLGFLAGSG